MTQLIGLVRLGRDAELRHTSAGEAVCSLSLAYGYGRKGTDGKRPTQWVEGALWGKRAESLAPHLTKGSLLCVTVDDLHVEFFIKSDNTQAVKLAGRVSELEFAGSPQTAAPAAPPAPRPPPPPAPAPTTGSGFDDMDDDIPF